MENKPLLEDLTGKRYISSLGETTVVKKSENMKWLVRCGNVQWTVKDSVLRQGGPFIE